jgi:hypothetical protein
LYDPRYMILRHYDDANHSSNSKPVYFASATSCKGTAKFLSMNSEKSFCNWSKQKIHSLHTAREKTWLRNLWAHCVLMDDAVMAILYMEQS